MVHIPIDVPKTIMALVVLLSMVSIFLFVSTRDSQFICLYNSLIYFP